MNYLMLDSNDITKVCGIISRKDILKEIKMRDLRVILEYPKKNLFRGKYVLVEEEFDDIKDKFDDVKIAEGKRGTYYANRDGYVYIVYNKSKDKKKLTKTKYRNHVQVKIGNTNYVLKNVIAKAFINGTQDTDVVICKNGDIYDCSVDNLEVVSRKEHCSKIGAMSRSQPVGLFENGKLVRKWTSTKKCAKDMYVSSVCISDYCNGKVKKPMFDVRWI